MECVIKIFVNFAPFSSDIQFYGKLESHDLFRNMRINYISSSTNFTIRYI